MPSLAWALAVSRWQNLSFGLGLFTQCFLNLFTVCTPSDFRILVVDDIDDNLLLLQTVLETAGYSVETANNGGSALAKIEDSPPDLILMDVMMPDMNGYEVTRQIRQNHSLPFMPILMVTAYDSINPGYGTALGVSNVIRKPIEFDRLLTKVATLLADADSSSDAGS